MVQSRFPAGVAQLVRARGSYPRCPGFKSLHRHQFFADHHNRGASEARVSLATALSVPSRALRTIRKHDMLPPGGRVLVALSGGPDSVALLARPADARAARRARRRRRGSFQSSAARRRGRCRRDVLPRAGGVARRCRSWSGAATCARWRDESGRSIEDAARQARYGFLTGARPSTRRRRRSPSATASTIRPRRSCCG